MSHPLRRTARRRALVVAAGGLAAITVAACGSDSDTGSTAAATPATTASPASAPAGVDAAARALLPDNIKTAGKIVNAINAPNVPMEFQKPGSKAYTGFDADVANAIGKKLGVRIEYKNVQFVQLLPGLASGRSDIVLSALSDKPERQGTADWVDYFKSGALMFVKKADAAKYPDLKSLCGKTIETPEGTSYIQEVPKLSKQICGDNPMKLLTVGGSLADETLQLKTKRAVAAVTGPETFGDLDTREPNQWAKIGETFAPGLYGIAVQKKEPKLRDAIKAALQSIIADGTYAKIGKTWNQTPNLVTEVQVNAGT